MEVFKLFGTIAVNNSEANQAIKETSNEAKDASKKVDDFGDSGTRSESKLKTAFAKVGSAAVKVGKVVASGVAVGATALGTLTVKAMNAAGELEQNMGGSEAVFKKHAKGMQETAQEAFKNMGLGTSDFLATANKMGSLFQGAGFSIKESADLASQGMQRAADVASIMGISTESAMESIAGAAKGNFTMMDNLGVAMNATTIEAYALSKGCKMAYKDMDNQTKIGYAMQMFLEKTTYAAGNYRKENETLAGSLTTAKAALTNFLDGSGSVKALANAFIDAADVIMVSLEDLFPRLVQGISKLVEKLAPKLPGMLEKIIPPLLNGAISLTNSLLAALPSLFNMLLSAVLSNLPVLMTGILGCLSQLANVIIENLPMIIDAGVQIIVAIAQGLTQQAPILIPLLVSGLLDAINALLENIDLLIDVGIQLLMGLADGLIKAYPILIEKMPEIVVKLAEKLTENCPKLLKAGWQLVVSLAKGWAQSYPEMLAAVVDMFIELGRVILDYRLKVAEWFTSVFKKGWEAIKLAFADPGAFFDNVWIKIKNAFGKVGSWFETTFSNAWQKVKDIFSSRGKVFEGIKEGISGTFKDVVNTLISGLNKIITVPFNKINEMLNKVRSVSVAGIKPFSGLWGENPLAVPQIPMLAKGGVLEKGQVGVLEGNGAEAVVPLEKNTEWIQKVAAQFNEAPGKTDYSEKFDRMIALMEALLGVDRVEEMKKAIEGTDIKWSDREIGRMVKKFA